jgi:hypothetical protein
VSVGSASSNWVLVRSSDSDGTPSSELHTGNVMTSLNPVIAQYVLTGPPENKIITDATLSNNSILNYSLFGSTIPANINMATVGTSGVIVCGGALTVNNASLTTLTGPLNVSGACSFGPIATIDISGTCDIGGATDIGGRLDVLGACEITGATNIIGALSGTAISALQSSIAGMSPANSITLSNGSAASPSISFSNSTNTDIFANGANEMSIAAAGVERLRLSSADTVVAGDLVVRASAQLPFGTDPNSVSNVTMKANGQLTCSSSFTANTVTSAGLIVSGQTGIDGNIQVRQMQPR